MGERPVFAPKNKIITKKELKHYEYLNSYVNPIEKAQEYQNILSNEDLTQSLLAQRLGVSRVRVTQILNLLKLSKEQQNYILQYGKDKLITERSLRKAFRKSNK